MNDTHRLIWYRFMIPSELGQDFAVFRKAHCLVFTVNQLTVNHDIKHSPFTLDEINGDAFFLLNGGRQTGGLRCIVSQNAVGNRHLHFFSPCYMQVYRPIYLRFHFVPQHPALTDHTLNGLANRLTSRHAKRSSRSTPQIILSMSDTNDPASLREMDWSQNIQQQ